MSLVGPRPHARQAKAAGRVYREVCANYALRHCMKPGMTGWAQVNGCRGETDTEAKIINRVAYDLDYINRWSFALDLLILVKTIPATLFPTNNV
jgi:lipopolysaccharide/colanic/teichoic acid biosynthesis glycosyltransferase